MSEPDPTFRFDQDGSLSVGFGPMNEDWREPICPQCSEPIPWVLDMASWARRGDGRFVLEHASCAWKPEAFDRQRKRAVRHSRV